MATAPFLLAVLGIGMFALPAGILGSGFVSEIEHEQRDAGVCLRCGQPVGGGPEERQRRR